MAVYGFLHEAKEPKGKAKRLLDKILSIRKRIDKNKSKEKEIEDNIEKDIKDGKKKEKEVQKESFVLEAKRVDTVKYYTIDVSEMNKRLQPLNNMKKYFGIYTVANDLKKFINNPESLTKEAMEKICDQIESYEKKTNKVLEKLYFESAKGRPIAPKNNKKYEFDNNCISESEISVSDENAIDKITESNKVLESAYDKIKSLGKQYYDIMDDIDKTFLTPISNKMEDWVYSRVTPACYDNWVEILNSATANCLTGLSEGIATPDCIEQITYSYLFSIDEAIRKNTEGLDLIKAGGKVKEPEVKKYHDQPEYGSSLIRNNSNITSKEFISDIKSRYNSKKIKKCNLDYLLNEFKRNDDWEDQSYKIYNRFITRNKATLDKIRTSDPVLVGENTIDSGSYQSYIIYCVKTNTFYQLLYHEDMFGYEVSTIDFNGVKEFYKELEDMGG